MWLDQYLTEKKVRKGDRMEIQNNDVAYRRKANAIHKWFVDNVQDWEDDCRSYLVTREQLQELVDTCKIVLESLHNQTPIEVNDRWQLFGDTEIAMANLPPTSGFFFGDTEINEWYQADLDNTVKQLQENILLKEIDPDVEYKYYYQSSW